MAGDMSMPRRAFLGGVTALGAMSGLRMPAHAAASPSVAEKEGLLFWDCYYNENTNHNVWSDRSPTKRDS